MNYKVLQGFYCGLWSDLTYYRANDPADLEELERDRKSYAENEPNTPHRVITRRIDLAEREGRAAK